MASAPDLPGADDDLSEDDQDVAEALDSDVTGNEDDEDGDYPTDEALGVDQYGTTAAEEELPESWDQRSARQTPEVSRPGDEFDDPDVVAGLTEPDDLDATEGELLGERADDPERPSAEEAAMHVTDDDA
jgi:hypothetical protein